MNQFSLSQKSRKHIESIYTEQTRVIPQLATVRPLGFQQGFEHLTSLNTEGDVTR